MVKPLASRRFRCSAFTVLFVPVAGQESVFSLLLGNLDQNLAERLLLRPRAALGMLRGTRTASLYPIHGQVWT